MDYACVIFDVDWTLTKPKTGGTFRESADDWQWLPGRREKLAEIQAEGIPTAYATNQGGVGFPWSKYSQADLFIELIEFGNQGNFDTGRICYSIPNEKALPAYYHPNDPRRKPNPGMLLEIMEELGVFPQETLMVGDRPEDQQAAEAAGCAFQWADEFFSEVIA